MKDNFFLRLCNLIVLSCLAFAFYSVLEVQAQSPAEDRAADLRIKLDDVKARQGELADQLKDLDDQMDPQNIENSLAGVGSTRPEDLRELRRRQLERQKISVQNKLSILAESQSRLETAIAEAEADAYYESARLVPPGPQIPERPQTPGSSFTQSNNPAKSFNASDLTKKDQTRPRRARRSAAKQASGLNNP